MGKEKKKKEYEGGAFHLEKHIALKQDKYWTYNVILCSVCITIFQWKHNNVFSMCYF
jgi:hypothetical protein